MPAKNRKPKIWAVPGRCIGDDALTIVLSRGMEESEIAARLRRIAWELDERDRACRAPNAPEFVFVGAPADQ